MRTKTLYRLFCCLVFISLTSTGNADSRECPGGIALAEHGMKIFSTDNKQGLTALLQAQKLCPDQYEINYNLGLALLQYGSISEAYRVWNDLLKTGDGDTKLYANAAWAAYKLDRSEEAPVHCPTGVGKIPG